MNSSFLSDAEDKALQGTFRPFRNSNREDTCRDCKDSCLGMSNKEDSCSPDVVEGDYWGDVSAFDMDFRQYLVGYFQKDLAFVVASFASATFVGAFAAAFATSVVASVTSVGASEVFATFAVAFEASFA